MKKTCVNFVNVSVLIFAFAIIGPRAIDSLVERLEGSPANALVGCGVVKSPSDVVLSIADLACLEGKEIADEDALALACNIEKVPAVRDFLRNLIGQKEAARKTGFVWGGDAGHSTPTTPGDRK